MSLTAAIWRKLRLFRHAALACLALAFAFQIALAQDAGPSQTTEVQATALTVENYHLDSGDKIKMTVYGEDDLSGDFDVDGSGNVQLPLIGQVHAAGLTIQQFQTAVEQKLANGYLVNPRVSAEVENYRPFTILGEVNKPGEYPYENGMTVLNAVALGGGFTYRANQDEVYILHKGSTQEVEAPANDKSLVAPGDTVRVAERIF
jgi:protein involved in polysaccharide export with SLBB domain